MGVDAPYAGGWGHLGRLSEAKGRSRSRAFGFRDLGPCLASIVVIVILEILATIGHRKDWGHS